MCFCSMSSKGSAIVNAQKRVEMVLMFTVTLTLIHPVPRYFSHCVRQTLSQTVSPSPPPTSNRLSYAYSLVLVRLHR